MLSDPETRKRYDAFGPDFRQVPEDVDPETYARARRRGRGPGGRAGGRRAAAAGRSASAGSAVDIDLEDLLGGMFGGRGGAGPMPGRRPGGRARAHRRGGVPGRAARDHPRRPGRPAHARRDDPGRGHDGQRIRLAGQGGPGVDGGPPGDLYLIVRLAEHPRYRVEGRDVHVRLPVTPWEAALGATVPLDTPGGEAKVKVPPGTSSGRRLRLRGRGLPNPRGAPGDLYAEVRIMVPAEPTEAERRLFEQLAAASALRPEEAAMTYAWSGSPGPLLDPDSFARACGLHPDLVRRLVALGLLEAAGDASGRLWLPRSQLAVVAAHPAAARRALAQLRRARARHRPARPHRRRWRPARWPPSAASATAPLARARTTYRTWG